MSERRNVQIHFRLTPLEVERMKGKMAQVGIRSQGAYLRKMALDGYCVRLDLQDVKELVSLLRRCSNNLNQYAKCVQLKMEKRNLYEQYQVKREEAREFQVAQKVAQVILQSEPREHGMNDLSCFLLKGRQRET